MKVLLIRNVYNCDDAAAFICFNDVDKKAIDERIDKLWRETSYDWDDIFPTLEREFDIKMIDWEVLDE